MIQKKVCMIGTSGVGKTSLVAKFVHSIFSDKYLTTVGVKIDKKTVAVDGNEVMLSAIANFLSLPPKAPRLNSRALSDWERRLPSRRSLKLLQDRRLGSRPSQLRFRRL